jgi:hypothetical protein
MSSVAAAIVVAANDYPVRERRRQVIKTFLKVVNNKNSKWLLLNPNLVLHLSRKAFVNHQHQEGAS